MKMKFGFRSFHGVMIIAMLFAGLSLGCENNAKSERSPASMSQTNEPPAQEIKANESESVDLDVPYVPTPQNVVDRMLELAEVGDGDTVYDLGSGDGRIVITAAKKHSANGIGIDLDPVRVEEARENAKKSGVEDPVEFRQANALEAKLEGADVITLYLLPSVNLQLRPALQQLPKGTRIVSHEFDMGDWEPVKEEQVASDGVEHTVYLWVVGQ